MGFFDNLSGIFDTVTSLFSPSQSAQPSSPFSGFGAVSTLFNVGTQLYNANNQRKAVQRTHQIRNDTAKKQAQDVRRKAQRLADNQRVRFLANGIALDGTAALLIDETENLGEEDALDILNINRVKNRAAKDQRRQKLLNSSANLIQTGATLFDSDDFWN